MSITLYRTISTKPGVVEPVEVRCATDKAVWLLSGFKVPRHRDGYEDYWDTEEEASNHWLKKNATHISQLEDKLVRAKVLHSELLDKYTNACLKEFATRQKDGTCDDELDKFL